jgi:cellulose synthase/poly-beta-1,6-N-acetylglucosamine synthase-like glycosyltransferase
VSRAGFAAVAFSCAATLPLLAACLAVAWRRRTAPRLPPPTPDEPVDATVLLPVRDEERNVEACLARLTRLDGAPPILVIDDGSRDHTRRLAEEAASLHRRLRVIDAGDLPAGWRGKVHALDKGLAQVGTSWALSTDADARLEPGALARARAHADAEGLDGVSLAARQIAGGWGEDLLVPGVFGLLDALLGDWHEAARGGPCIASGQFLLFRVRALHAAGGFERIRSATIDDVALFELLRSHGSRTGFVRAPEVLATRMYDDLSNAVSGWRRNFGAIFHGRERTWRLSLAVILAPWAGIFAVAAAFAGDALSASQAATGLAGVFSLGSVSSAANRVSGGQRLAGALIWPVECLILAATLFLGRRDRRRGRLTSWKGRTLDV